MKSLKTISKMLGGMAIALGVSQAAWAVDATGTLNFAANNITLNSGSQYFTGDVNSYSLGSSLNGPLTLSYTGSGYNTALTSLIAIIATDANTALTSPGATRDAFAATLLAATDNAAVTAAMTTFVTGYVANVWGYSYLPSAGTATTPMPTSLTAGTSYYAMVFGATLAAPSYVPYADSAVSYTLGVTAVPEPQALAMMLAGLGLVGGFAARRRRAA